MISYEYETDTITYISSRQAKMVGGTPNLEIEWPSYDDSKFQKKDRTNSKGVKKNIFQIRSKYIKLGSLTNHDKIRNFLTYQVSNLEKILRSYRLRTKGEINNQFIYLKN